MRAYLHIFCGLSLVIFAACATPTPKPDEGEIARAVLQEQAEAARAAAATPDPANEPSPEPIALPAPIWNPTERGLQHIASGYICPREAAGFKRIGQDQFPGLQAGHDVACVYETPDRMRVRLHLTNFGRTVSPAAHLKGVETTIRDANPNAKIISTSPATRASDHALIFKVAPSPAINAPAHDQTAVWIDAFGPWHVKARGFYAADQAQSVTKLVERLFVSARETLPAGPQ